MLLIDNMSNLNTTYDMACIKPNLTYDFYIPSMNLMIELDGEQHFSQISNWNTPESTQEKDSEKIKYCINNGYSIIHIYQPEVWKNTYDWKEALKSAIFDLSLESEPKVVFISCCDKYSNHIKQLDNTVKYEILNPTY